MHPPPNNGQWRKAGFTLVELLAVIGIIALLLVVTAPAITSLSRAQNFTSSVYDLNSLVRQAKAFSMSQNTFVWMGLQSTTSNGNPVLVVAIVTGQTGLSTDLANSKYRLSLKPTILQNVQLEGSTYMSLPGVDQPNNVDISNSKYKFTQAVPGVTSNSFTSVIAFSPDGAVSLDPASTARCVGIGLQAVPAAAHAQIAAIQISGLNGRSTLFRQ